jgi:hypothetical protein
MVPASNAVLYDKIPSQVGSWLKLTKPVSIDFKRGGVAQMVRAWDS